MAKDKVTEFLRESNAIEGVYDDDSLQQAQYAWEYIIKQDRLTTGVVLKTHKTLMLHQPLMPDERGYFRQVGVWVGATYGADWRLVPDLIDQWCKQVNDMVGQMYDIDSHLSPDNILYNTKLYHVQYERIHPFVDGNGRTGRIFMNWMLQKLDQPILVIKDSEKRDYYKWFTEGVR